MLEERLTARLRSDPAVRAKLRQAEAAVAAGKLAPTLAVEEIAQLLGRVMALTILVTGFGPFPGAPFNPTGPLVERLARLRRPALADVDNRPARVPDQLRGGRPRPAQADRAPQAGRAADVRPGDRGQDACASRRARATR